MTAFPVLKTEWELTSLPAGPAFSQVHCISQCSLENEYMYLCKVGLQWPLAESGVEECKGCAHWRAEGATQKSKA